MPMEVTSCRGTWNNFFGAAAAARAREQSSRRRMDEWKVDVATRSFQILRCPNTHTTRNARTLQQALRR